MIRKLLIMLIIITISFWPSFSFSNDNDILLNNIFMHTGNSIIQDYYLAQNGNASQNNSGILVHIDEIGKYITDCPVYPGNVNIKVFYLSHLIQTAVQIYNQYGKNLNIYSAGITNHPTNSDYMLLIDTTNTTGFIVIKPSTSNVLARDYDILFAIICPIENADAAGDFCNKPRVIIDNNQYSIIDILDYPIFKITIKNSVSSLWKDAG